MKKYILLLLFVLFSVHAYANCTGKKQADDAKYKYFVTAESKVRAERRYKELIERGTPVEFDALHEEIKQRDYNDSHRDFAPLKQAEDAIVVDTSNMTVEEVVNFILADVRSR